MRGHLLDAARAADDWLAGRFGPTRVLFVLSDGYGFSCQAEVVRHLANRPGVVVATTTDRPRLVSELAFGDADEAALFRAHYVAPGRAAWRKWHMVVDTHRSPFYPRRHALRLFMHHGPGFGILGSKVAVAEDFDCFLGLSAHQRHIFERLRPGLFDDRHAFFAVGFPKDDPFARGGYDRAALLEELGLDPALPTLLITSHWQTGATLRRFRDVPFARLAEAGGGTSSRPATRGCGAEARVASIRRGVVPWWRTSRRWRPVFPTPASSPTIGWSRCWRRPTSWSPTTAR